MMHFRLLQFLLQIPTNRFPLNFKHLILLHRHNLILIPRSERHLLSNIPHLHLLILSTLIQTKTLPFLLFLNLFITITHLHFSKLNITSLRFLAELL